MARIAVSREQAAVKRASRTRLLSDMRHAAWILGQGSGHRPIGQWSRWARGFACGAIEATGSLTLRACLLTAFGG